MTGKGFQSWERKRGFTLIELLVALAILAVAAAAFVPAFTYIAQANQQNKVRMTASSIAAGVVEEIRALPYDSIGTSGGNPSGSIPQTQTVSAGGILFTVETQITWGSSKTTKVVAGVDPENVVALKNIRVIVKAPGAFTGAAEKVDEINSIASRESEEALVKNGHIRVVVKNSQNMAISFYTNANIVNEAPTPATNQTVSTDGNGKALFGVLNAGKYTVRVKLPDNATAGPGQTVAGGWIVKSGVEVQDWQTTEAIFYMEDNSKMGTIDIKMIDSVLTTQAITLSGKLSLDWTEGGATTALLNGKAFSTADFVDNGLPTGFIGYLWPTGTYTLRIADVPGYINYDMDLVSSGKPVLSDATEWDGTMTPPGKAYHLTIKMRAGVTSHFYVEDTAADFNNTAQLMQNTTAVSGSGDLLQLAYIGTQTNLASRLNVLASSTYNLNSAGNSCDGDPTSYWRQGNNTSLPQWLKWSFGESKCVGSVTILAGVDGREPRSISFESSDDDANWTSLYTVELNNTNTTQGPIQITSPQIGQHFRLKINSLWNSRAAISEVQLWSKPGYAFQGKRVSKVIPLGTFTSAPVFKIYWSAILDADTSVKVSTAVTDSDVMPADSSFTAVTSGGAIPGIVKGANLTGKYLWIMESMSTSDITKTPSLDWLYIDY
jgi:prepilin-type N-terminal cleavage/methylation domain-containing protein